MRKKETNYFRARFYVVGRIILSNIILMLNIRIHINLYYSNEIIEIKFVSQNGILVTPASECLLFLGKQTQEIDIECTSGSLTQIMGDLINNAVIRFAYDKLRVMFSKDIQKTIIL